MRYLTGNVDARGNDQLEQMLQIKKNKIFKKTIGQISDQLSEKKEIKALNNISLGAKTQAFKDKDKAIKAIVIGGVVIAGLYIFAGTRLRRAY